MRGMLQTLIRINDRLRMPWQRRLAERQRMEREAKRGARDRDTENIWTGDFEYAGGYPDAPAPVNRTRVALRRTVLAVQRRPLSKSYWEDVFVITTADIRAVRHEQMGTAGLFTDAPDQFIDLDVEKRGRTFTVRFKAWGFTHQKDAFGFYAAINALLGASEAEQA